MKKFINGMIVGLLLGVGGYWLLSRVSQRPAVQEAQQELQESSSNMVVSVGQTMVQLEKIFDAKLAALELQADTIKEELASAGKVVRRKARDIGTDVANAAGEAKTTAAIKTKLAADPDLSTWNISVSTTGGVVTLSGTVSSYGLIGRAMLLALETEGVSQVISTLQVR